MLLGALSQELGLTGRNVSKWEVDYLVATDAIGMGLNLNINHVAFAQRVKFDGKGLGTYPPGISSNSRSCWPTFNDGTFGVTADCSILDEAW